MTDTPANLYAGLRRWATDYRKVSRGLDEIVHTAYADSNGTYSDLRIGDVEELLDRFQHARDLHRAGTVEIGLTPSSASYCVTCKTPAPCGTIRALDGQE